MDIEDRLKYYREKYGEDFELKDSDSRGAGSDESKENAKTAKKGFLKGLFGKNKQ
jgi:hypothetical protein